MNAAHLAMPEADRLGEICRSRLETGEYKAVVRTRDYQICIPVVKWSKRLFGRNMPPPPRPIGFDPSPKTSLAQVISETGQIALKLALSKGLSGAGVFVDRFEEKSGRIITARWLPP
jgi:hypothetical protein